MSRRTGPPRSRTWTHSDWKVMIGSKPAVFARWVFGLLGALPGDEFVDVFPGSGGMARAWQLYTAAGA